MFDAEDDQLAKNEQAADENHVRGDARSFERVRLRRSHARRSRQEGVARVEARVSHETSEIGAVEGNGRINFRGEERSRGYSTGFVGAHAIGVYKADLAKVVEVNYGDNSCVVKILPRFDYQHLADKESGEAKNKPKPTVRPAARLFSETEAKNKNLSFERWKFDRTLNDRVDVLCGTHKIKDGYLLKRCALTTVKLTEAPSLDEIQKFAPGGDEEDDDFDDEEDDEDGGARRKKSTNNHINRLAKLTMNEKKASKSAAARFLVGDQVIVVEGDLRNLEGVIKRVDADGRVIVDPSHKDLTDPLPFNPEQLRKHFKVGSTVRVVHGAHEGASGMVVKVSDQIATVFSTSTNEEFSVFMRDLADDAEAATRVDRIGEYALHDLAMLDDGNVGVLTRVEKDVAFVLTNAGTLERPNVKACKLAGISNER